ncbi:hypothetical protein [Clostridium sp.]|uniref:hypothetical protein n=1 Tax=Clostridium sp. TaxID=1506 RepID=UPI001A3B13D8|nr:hypothetical protein [Clostridium sp.]MBK5236571.1 hypothetical protein [Clostridium sp.]
MAINTDKGEFKININKYQYMYELYKDAEYYKYNMMCTNAFDHEIFYKNSLNEKLREISTLIEEYYEFPSNNPTQDRDGL